MSRVSISSNGKGEFLEGIDVRDPEFEDWLRAYRQTDSKDNPPEAQFVHAAPKKAGPPARDLKIAIRTRAMTSGHVEWFLQLFSDATALQLREYFSIDLIMDGSSDDLRDTLTVDLEAIGLDNNTLGVRISLNAPENSRQIWAANRHLKSNGGPPVETAEATRLLNELVQAIGDTLLQGGDLSGELDTPDALCRNAIRSLFTMKKDCVAEADRLFAKAFDLEPRGLYMAWRAQIKAIQFVERHSSNREGLKDAGREFAARALEIEPNNSMVLATLANTTGHLLQDKSRSLFLAKRGVLLNPANPMAWWALASAHVYAGDEKMSYAVARNARNLAILSPHRFWWDNQLFGAALTQGKIDEARKLAEEARAQNAVFRPSLRYLIAFYANDDRHEDALQVAEDLKVLEPDFTIERLVKDREYPASLLHRSPGLDLKKVSALI